MDTITCSLDATPSTDIFSLTEEGPGTVDIINKEKGYFDTYNLTNKIHRSIFKKNISKTYDYCLNLKTNSS